MADSWLIVAAKVKNRSAVDLKNMLWKGAIGGASGTASKKLTKRFVAFVSEVLVGLLGGFRTGNVYGVILDTSATFPTGNIACVQANAAADTITWTYGGLTVVLTEAGTDENGFARGASNTTCAANLAAAINAHSILGGLFTATPSVGNCAIVGKIPTAFLQDFALTTNDGTAFSFTQLATATEGAAQFLPQSFDVNLSR